MLQVERFLCFRSSVCISFTFEGCQPLLAKGNFLPLVLGDRVAFAFAVDCSLFAVLQAKLGWRKEQAVPASLLDA